jgi:integrase/recombinase XerD
MPDAIETKPETFSIKVITRHSADCPQKGYPLYRKCKCRKSLYLYESGKVRYHSAKTRSWTKAEEYMRKLIDARDPVKRALMEIEQKRKERAEAQAARRITISDALDQWTVGIPKRSRSRAVQIESMASKIRSWATEQKLTYLEEIKPSALYEWRDQWNQKAKAERDRLAPATANLYASLLRRFCRWAVDAEYIDRDPSRLIKHQKYDHVPTQPLTNEDQFKQVLAATYELDAHRYTGRDTPEYGPALRAIFQLQRWTGIRLIDAVMLKRTAVKGGLLTIVTKKTGKVIKDRPLPQSVIDALAAVEPSALVRDGYYFWPRGCADEDNLTTIWTGRIKKLNQYLSLEDDEGDPMAFRSHMLRDTFAVELLLQGMPLEDVSFLLTHDSVKMTEKYYAKWIARRRDKVHADLVAAMTKMGAII